MRRVVITGMGCVTPLGNDLTTTWKGVVEGKSGAARISAFDATNFSCQIAAEVKGFEPETLVEKKDIRRYDRFILLGLKAAREALGSFWP